MTSSNNNNNVIYLPLMQKQNLSLIYCAEPANLKIVNIERFYAH